jgi:calcineurin-like phosphoesterase family protein
VARAWFRHTMGGVATWYTSDLHFGHANISTYAGRPFNNVDEMATAIVEQFNLLVDPDDTVFILGDVAMGQIKETLPLVGLLHGHLTLIPGNHDRCWAGYGAKAHGWREAYLEAGFSAILDDPEPITLAGRHTLRCHFPYLGGGDHTSHERYSKHRPVDQGAWLLCGHVHEKWKQRGRQINVGIDAWGGRPVEVSELEQLVLAGPRDLPAEPWQAHQ